jgi:hypothetical protein
MGLDDLMRSINICRKHHTFRRAAKGKHYCVLLQDRHEAEYCVNAGGFIYVEKNEGWCSVQCPYIECRDTRHSLCIKQK